MGIADTLRRFFGQMGAVPQMARADLVASLVPADTRYVTVGPVAVLPDVRSFNHGEPGETRRGTDLGFLQANQRQEIALLVLTAERLVVMERAGSRWSRELGRITDLDGRRASGFLVFTTESDGLAVGTQTPVEVPPGAGFRTLSGMTNLFSGWDKQLTPYGVKTHF